MKRLFVMTLSAFLAIGIFFSAQIVVADDKPSDLQPEIYKLDKKDKYEEKANKKCDSDEKKPIGSLSLVGDYNSKNAGIKDGMVSYPINGTVSLKYSCEDKYEVDTYKDFIDNKDKWFIVSDNAKSIGGYSFKEKIQSGGVLVLVSADGEYYEEYSHSTDVFKNTFVDEELVEIRDSNCRNGLYVRIYVSYKMKRRVKDTKLKDDYEEFRFLEKYDLFLYDESPISIFDIDNVLPGKELNGMSSVPNGFVVYYNGFSGSVSVKNPGGETIKIEDGQSFTEPGEYKVLVKGGLFKDYEKTITVTDGIKSTPIDPTVYELKDSQGYDERTGKELAVNEKTVFSDRSHTRVMIGDKCKVGTHDGMVGYGTYGHELNIYLTYNQNEKESYDGWMFCSDEWGNQKGETVTKEAITVGTVGSGALIVQYSDDGKVWTTTQTNTDLSRQYKTEGYVMISSPSGEKLIEGQYCRIYYAYEVKNGNQIKNYLEKYEFYICYDDLNAIVFNNLTLIKDLEEESAEHVDMGISNLKPLCNTNTLLETETLNDGDYTVSGFMLRNQIENTNYKVNAEITIKWNGVQINVKDGDEYTSEGKYDIDLISNIGTRKHLTLYVDRRSDEEKIADYFGGEPINGKRVFSEMYPTFEGGDLYFNLNAADRSHIPLTGKIWNTDTEETVFSGKIKSETVVIENPGHYRAEFTTAKSLNADELSGDVWFFSSVFDVIEQGTAPGPVINQKELKEHNISSVLGGKLVYYGVAVKTAGEGNIVYLYDSYDDALDFAKKYERNRVVQNSDNQGDFWKYENKEYESLEKAFEEADSNAVLNVQKRYIDPNHPQTYYSLSEDTLDYYNGKLETLQIVHNVFLFADNQKEKMIDINSMPIVNDWRTYEVDPTGAREPKLYEMPYIFMKDDLEIDSSKIIISDQTRSKFIEADYEIGVQGQLEKADFDTGVITIEEETKYGDSVIYDALYFRPGVNNTVFTLELFKDNETQNLIVSQETAPKTVIETDGFHIVCANDEYDPYGLIRVSRNGEEIFFCMTSDAIDRTWYNEGDYTISCTNRCGSTYDYEIKVLASDIVTVNVLDEGNAVLDSFEVRKDDSNWKLPLYKYEKVGYILVGFENINTGEKYTDSISEFGDFSSIEIKQIWEPKTIVVVYYDENNQIIKQDRVLYDSEYEFMDYTSSSNNSSFVGWTSDGVNIFNGKAVIGIDENLELRPVLNEESITVETSASETSVDSAPDITTISNNEIEEKNAEKSESGFDFKINKYHVLFIGIGMVVVAVVISSIILIKERKEH